MSQVQAVTRNGTPWVPQYLESIDIDNCIGCGRCFKVCTRNVLSPMAVTEDGDVVDFDDDDAERKIMSVANPGDCIGCQACARVCSKDSMRFSTAAMM